MSDAKERREELDIVSKLNGYGSLTSAQSNNLRGLSFIKNALPIPANQDAYGLTFFTRPKLNLSYDNLAASRLLTPLMGEAEDTIARAIRCMLDPIGEKGDVLNKIEPVISQLTDPEQAFLPLLTNNLVSMSGWPDFTVDTFTSQEGLYKEAFSMVDGTTHMYGTYDITANFRNIQGDPITFLFMVWVHYAAMVYNGTMVPYPDAIIENYYDYNTRIYRLVLDYEHKYVQKIAACGAAFPMASPLGNAFNFANDSHYNRENDQLGIPFRCMGVMYLDPILIDEFNGVVAMFNKSMSVENIAKGAVIKIDPRHTTLKNYLNHKAYPRINPDTMELEWYAKRDVYMNAIQALNSRGFV